MATTPIWTYRGVEAGVDLSGYEVEAPDGSIGTVEQATRQTGTGYLVVDTGTWIFGRRVLLPAGLVDRIDTSERKIFVSRSRDEIRNAPEYEESGVPDTYQAQLGMYDGGLGATALATTPVRSTQSRSSRKASARSSSGSRSGSRSRSSSSSRSRAQRSSDGPTRDELYEQAKRLGIPGRSKMTKAELQQAVEQGGHNG